MWTIEEEAAEASSSTLGIAAAGGHSRLAETRFQPDSGPSVGNRPNP
jgi:hypothetical protein